MLFFGTPTSAPRDDARLNRAYICFGFIGLAILIIAGGSTLIGDDVSNALRFVLYIVVPFSLATLVAFIYGVILTIKIRRPALVVLSVTSVLILPVVFALGSTDEPDPRPFNAIPRDPSAPCSTGWTVQENLFIKADGSKLSACVDMDDIQRTGKVLMLPDPKLQIDPSFQPPPRVRPPYKLARGLSLALLGILPTANILICTWWFAIGRRIKKQTEQV